MLVDVISLPFSRSPTSWHRSTRPMPCECEWLGWRKSISTCGRLTVIIRMQQGRPLFYAIVLPGQKSVFRAGCRPDSIREGLQIGPSAGGPILMFSRLESGRNPTRKPDFRPGATIASHRVHGDSGEVLHGSSGDMWTILVGKAEIEAYDKTQMIPQGGGLRQGLRYRSP